MASKTESQDHTILRFKQRYALKITREEYWYLCNWISIHLALTTVESFIKSVKRRTESLSIVEFSYRDRHIVALFNVKYGYILTVYPQTDSRWFSKDQEAKLESRHVRKNEKIVCRYCKKLVEVRYITKTSEGLRVCKKHL